MIIPPQTLWEAFADVSEGFSHCEIRLVLENIPAAMNYS